MKVYSLLLVVALVGCTKRNPAVCCLDAADCDEAGLGEIRDCAAGLACVDHECVVPSCSMTGCEAATPVCNITTDICEGCMDSSNCSKFSDTDVCDTSTGACVECVAAADCRASKPVCDDNACRACKLDSECPSGACGDDGACVAESAIVYMDPGGTDAGTCSRSAPCRTVDYAVKQTAQNRSHFVFSPGAYVESGYIGTQQTSATHVFLHGGGATMSAANDENSILRLLVPSTVRDLTLVGPASNAAITVYNGPHVLERLVISGANLGLAVSGAADIRDVTVAGNGSSVGITLAGGSYVNLERAVLHGGTTGVRGGLGDTLNLTNVVVYGTAGLALDIPSVGGTINFSTIADSGTDEGTGPRAVRCGGGMTVRSSIIWAPGVTARASIAGCNLVSSIAGPTITPGAMNSDPLFVNAVARDYHIAPNSPARDAVEAGPETDFEGDPRPRGARFDIGADEAAP